MESEIKEYQCFLAALRDFDSRFGWGAKSSVAAGSGFTAPFLSLVVAGDKSETGSPFDFGNV